jgi:hypothetical protein
MRNMAAANAAYGADWADRQFTACPDDAGLVNGSCQTYVTTIACPPQQLLGWAANGGMWGYWLGQLGLCQSFPAGCQYNWQCYKPIDFGTKFGSFRLPNVKSFAGYVNNKWYDPVFWAPKDKINLNIAEKYFMNPDQFSTNADGSEVSYSTYVFSPAAMWSPEVLSDKAYKNPDTLAGGWRSPAAGQSRYPDLKTRMLEHSWLQNAEGNVNPNFIGGDEPWYFNQGYNSAPVTMFFDGHVAIMSVADAMESDSRAKNNVPQGVSLQEKGLWHRSTPFGGAGYYIPQSYDFLVNTSYHILTTNGILGRDSIGAK